MYSLDPMIDDRPSSEVALLRTGNSELVRISDDTPDPDAVRLIKKYGMLFESRGQISTVIAYGPGYSLPESSAEIRRAIGGATLLYRKGEKLVDGMTLELIHRAGKSASFKDFRAISLRRRWFGRRKRSEPFPLLPMAESLGSSELWKMLPSKSPGGPKYIEFGYRFTNRGTPISGPKITFLGTVDSLTGEVTSIRAEANDQGFPQVKAFIRELNWAFEDYERRTELAELYRSAPVATGMSAELRAQIKAGLESVEIVNGSYSREGFSSGPFPYPQTRTNIRDTAMTLVFSRCSNCGSVEELTIEGAELPEQELAVARLSSGAVAPWHESICSAF